jgi:NADH dehydrogenase [ubiquinone] 1 alpha subcomplex assembly factor 7
LTPTGGRPLAERLARRIAADGPLSLAEYMTACLFDPEAGVYAAGDPLGAAGHFTTAPEISQVFGELLGLWAASVWQEMGAPARLVFAELGPGRGTLMADALRGLAVLPPFLEAAEVVLVETSPHLRAVQERTLQGRPVRWVERVEALPEGPLVLLANEVFDTLPIRQYVKTPEGWAERRIGLGEGGGLQWVLGPRLPGTPPGLTRAKATAPVGALAEACTAGEAIAGEIGRRLAANGGAALLVDYGYFPSAPGETLQALARHEVADPLAAPGTADLTAHVDFQALAAAAEAAGACAHGPVTQKTLLEALGVHARAEALKARATSAQAADLDAGVARLIAPDRMGTLFKALALTGPDMAVPAGFPQAG